MLTNKDIGEIYIKSNVKTLSHSSPNDINMENIENLRKEAHSNEEINVIIRDDNLDSFVDYIYKNNLDLNGKINESFLENNFYLMNSTSLLEYSMAFGSINIFRYLWMKKVYYSYYSLYFSIIGGNYEIIHILEEESRYKFDLELYNHSLEYYRPEICEYLLNLIQKKPISIYNIFVTSVVNEWEIIYKFLNEDEISNNVTFKQDNKSENNEIGKPSFSNDSNQSRFLNRLTYLSLDKTLCQYLFYHFVLQQSELNFIFKDGVYYLFFSKSFIQCLLKRSF